MTPVSDRPSPAAGAGASALPSPYDPGVQQERYAFYRRLRDEAPVYLFRAPDARQNLCLITRFRDVTSALRDPRFVRETGKPRYDGPPRRSCPYSFAGAITHWMVYRDAPHHRRLRDPVRSTLHELGPALRPLVHEVAADVVRRLPSRGSTDLARTLAFPIPARVICRLAGLGDPDEEEFRRWMSGVSAALERSGDSSAWDHADSVTAEMNLALMGALKTGRPTPFMERLRERVRGRVTTEELVANLILVLFAGFETTLNLICNLFHTLLAHPDALLHVRRNPEDARRAVDESLRFEAPVQMTFRGTPAATPFAGSVVPAGTRVALVLASANRDERMFRDPDRFDIWRDTRRHLAFGHQAHYCPGASLGRLEAEIALQLVLARYSLLRPTGVSTEWKPGITYRALKQLPVELTEDHLG